MIKVVRRPFKDTRPRTTQCKCCGVTLRYTRDEVTLNESVQNSDVFEIRCPECMSGVPVKRWR